MEKELLEMHKLHLGNLLNERQTTLTELLLDDFLVSYTYDAISLETNGKMSFDEMKRIIKIGFTTFKSTTKEKCEVINHVAAFKKMIDHSKQTKDITEEELKDLHDLLLNDILIGGVYRNVNIQIIGGQHQPPDYIKVYDRMKRLFEEIPNLELNDFEKGIYIHAMIAKIHPFLDGNGRISRLILNRYLLKSGYVPITIPLEEKDIYFKNMEIFKVEKDIKPLTNYIINLINKTYETLIEKLDI